ncbi:MAG: hypothetical protein IJR26_00380 [Bacteroidales bacterium]|nr:hypothetical protein [Bacteroidales bacterium]
MKKYEIFWKWFSDNCEQLTMLDDLLDAQRQHLLADFDKQLEAYCYGMTYEISEATPTGRTVTFSAEGDTDLFRYVVELVDNAPDFDWWDFVAFKQPKGTDLRVTFDKYHFETRNMFFLQLESEEQPEVLGIRVALPNPVADDDDQLVGVYVTLEAMIGEFDCATLIGYLDTCAIPTDPKAAGFRPLDDFPAFVEWFKGKEN